MSQLGISNVNTQPQVNTDNTIKENDFWKNTMTYWRSCVVMRNHKEKGAPMNTSAPTEAQMKEAIAELAKASVRSLKSIFATPPAGKSWEEIEAGMAQGKSLKDLCGISGERMDGAYEEARRKLERKDYAGAKEVFASLCLYDQQTPKYWGGFAKCCEGLKYYEEAAGCYKMMALVTGGTDPLPYIGMAYCHISLNDKKSALEALETGKEAADPDSDRSALELMDELIGICRR